MPSILSDGYVDSRDIEALRNQKGVGEWSVEQLQQLRDTGRGVLYLILLDPPYHTPQKLEPTASCESCESCEGASL